MPARRPLDPRRLLHLAASLALVLGSLLLAPSPATAALNDTASGAGTIPGGWAHCPEGSMPGFTFAATGTGATSATGTWGFTCATTDTRPEYHYSGEVNCLVLTGDTALVGGVTTESDLSAFPVGQQLYFEVQDAGPEAGDHISSLYSGACTLQTGEQLVVSGEITIGQAPPPEPAKAPTCDRRSATIYVEDGTIVGGPDSGQSYTGILRGTDGADVIVGSTRRDSISAGAGTDVVCSLGGIDTVSGDADADKLIGGAGNDALSGGLGNDTMQGRGGDDTLTGGEGADRLVGGPGEDLATDFNRAEGDTRVSIP